MIPVINFYMLGRQVIGRKLPGIMPLLEFLMLRWVFPVVIHVGIEAVAIHSVIWDAILVCVEERCFSQYACSPSNPGEDQFDIFFTLALRFASPIVTGLCSTDCELSSSSMSGIQEASLLCSVLAPQMSFQNYVTSFFYSSEAAGSSVDDPFERFL